MVAAVSQGVNVAEGRGAGGKDLVLRTKTEPRCKICMSPHRIAIEKLIIMRSNQEDNTDGQRVTRQYIMDFAQKEWGLYLTRENIDTHSEKHLGFKQAMEKTKRELGRQSDKLLQMTVLTEILADLDVDRALDEVIARGIKNMREEDGASITVDHLLKAIDSKKKHSSSSPVDALVDAAARAMNVVLDGVEKPKPEVIEGVVIEVQEEV